MAETRDEVVDERAVEARYTKALQRKPQAMSATAGSRSFHWTRTNVPKPVAAPPGQLIGRIALTKANPELDGLTDFYIGDRYLETQDGTVFSWAAPIACTFFRGISHHFLCDEVAVVRTFRHAQGVIANLVDEPLVDTPPAPAFKRRELRIPTPPPSSSRPPAKSAAAQAIVTPQTMTPRSGIPAAAAIPTTRLASTAPQTRAPEPGTAQPRADSGRLRAEQLLREQLAAPRRDALSPVLSTLQPDQYEVVAKPGTHSQVIEGHPGTGKTIIAAHRAAYLVNPEIPRDHHPSGRVLLIGPSDAYSVHIRKILEQLTSPDSELSVRSMPELVAYSIQRSIPGQGPEPNGPVARTWRDVSEDLARFVNKAITSFKGRGALPQQAHQAVTAVYAAVRGNAVLGTPLTSDPEWDQYLRALPELPKALQLRAHQPLIALISTKVNPDRTVHVGHVIVDEAQDVMPLEWEVIDEINKDDHWTLLGDMNQRRSDHALHSWDHVCGNLGILDDRDRAPLVKLERGYRSTSQIIRYANRLLPKADRMLASASLQTDGTDPLVQRVPPSAVARSVAVRAGEVLDKYPTGTVAVISVDPTSIRTELRRAGWVAQRGNLRRWTLDDQAVTVIHPDAARGLEFDAVVVVEPADFPPNLARQGPLYTALTRANKELTVVHSKQLPRELQ